MPTLRDSGDVETPFGTLIRASCAVGEIDLNFGKLKEVSFGAAARSWVNYPLAQHGEGQRRVALFCSSGEHYWADGQAGRRSRCG